MELEKLIERYPRLYHMAEVDTWNSIREHGLRSTSAILDLHSIEGDARLPYESLHRPDMMTVRTPRAPAMILRDQKPMTDDRLRMALSNGLTPREWYERLNRKVFFWATEHRLNTLLNARFYRSVHHDVLTIDGKSFFSDFHDRIELCHMNSGNTFPIPHRRDASIFKSIPYYPTKTNGNPTKEVAEVTVDYSVANIGDYVISVRKMRGTELLDVVYERE
jgi:hypothetical protein